MVATKEEIGRAIAAERVRRNWSREKLSEETGIPTSTIGTYERGKSMPTIDTCWVFADAFRMSIGALVGRNEEKYLKQDD